MMRNIAPLLLVLAYGSCMKMRETVERTVMVRTTGSDLQPAATGYIYKKESDGPASVFKMETSDVMEHLAKLYEKPHAYTAPIPAADGPFHAKEEDGNQDASHDSEAIVKPVVEGEENGDEHVDGKADEDYGKIHSEHVSDFGDYKKGFADYLHGPGHFEDGLYEEYGGGKEYGLKGHHEHGDKGYKGFEIIHHYGKGGAGNYHNEKHEGYGSSGEGGHKKHHDEADAYGKHYANGHGYKGGDHGHKESHSKGEEVDGYHKIYDKNEYKKDHDFYDKEAHKGGYHKYADGHAYHGSDAGGFKKGGAGESGYYEDDFGKGGFVDKDSGEKHEAGHTTKEEGESSFGKHGDFGAKGGKYGGKSYGYAIKH